MDRSTLPATGRLPLLRAYQARTLLGILHAMARYPGATQTVLFPRQAGKNEVAASLVTCLLVANAARGGSIVVCAPTVTPQAEISRRRTLLALTTASRLLPRGVRPRLDDAAIRLGNATAHFLSASPAAHVAGHTASIALIADEAQDIDEEWFDRQFRPMAASTRAPAILFGTPWDGETLLDRAVAANRAHDKMRAGRAYRDFLPRHHEAGWLEVAAANPLYGDYVRQERERLGERHPLFVTQYGLQCVADAGRLFSAADLLGLAGTYEREAEPSPGYRYVAGLDIGGEGAKSDASVLTIARVADRRCDVVAHIAWDGAPISVVFEAMQQLAAHWRLERLCVDSTGLGQPLAKDLERELGSRVEPVHFSASVKSELGYQLVAAVQSGRLALYADDGTAESLACRSELAACRARFSGPALQWEAPSGRHDDYAVSLALCVRAADGLGAPRVAVGRHR
jgi:hypothetical protein